MSFKKFAALAVAAFTVAGCAKEPMSVERTENSEIKYEVLFNRKGCEVGRFYDNGHAVYTTICPATGTSTAESVYNKTCGKGCVTEERVKNTQIRPELN